MEDGRPARPGALRTIQINWGSSGLADVWKLRDEDARGLLGRISNGTYYSLKRRPSKTLDQDKLARISLLLGIFKALNILYNKKLADAWVQLPNSNPMFGGESPLAAMIKGWSPGPDPGTTTGGRAARRSLVAPRITQLRQDDTHRLIPARYREDGASMLARLTSDPQHLHDLFQLEAATNERLLGESNLLPGITVHELVFGTPDCNIVNAAFTRARPAGSRFNGADRGGWYCAFTLDTAQAEVSFHFAQSLREVNWEESETATYREYLADFRGGFQDIRKNTEYASCLDPARYVASQQLARELLHQESAGVIYPAFDIAEAHVSPAFGPRWWSTSAEVGWSHWNFRTRSPHRPSASTRDGRGGNHLQGVVKWKIQSLAVGLQTSAKPSNAAATERLTTDDRRLIPCLDRNPTYRSYFPECNRKLHTSVR